MSCPDGSCLEPRKRRNALILFGVLIAIFIVLSGFSFLDSRGQVTPDTVSFGPYQASDGKRVFQAYNCMGCHTLVGNGAYFAPDLTKEYRDAGPAWLMAFIPSAGGWPTEGALKTQLLNKDVAKDAGVSSIEEYYKKYPGAKERVERRGGKDTYMPNLAFTGDEVGQLVAFLKYTSAMNTEGWPPEVKTGSLEDRVALAHGRPAAASAQPGLNAVAPQGGQSLADIGAAKAKDAGCMACHSVQGKRMVGPAWDKLYGTDIALDDGSTVKGDEAYLTESILDPNAKIVATYPKGVMPPTYSKSLSGDDVEAIVAYIKSLE